MLSTALTRHTRRARFCFDIDRGGGDPRGGCPLHSIPCPIRLFAGSNLNPIEGSFPNVAKDVCRVLGMDTGKGTHKRIGRFPTDERRTHRLTVGNHAVYRHPE